MALLAAAAVAAATTGCTANTDVALTDGTEKIADVKAWLLAVSDAQERMHARYGRFSSDWTELRAVAPNLLDFTDELPGDGGEFAVTLGGDAWYAKLTVGSGFGEAGKVTLEAVRDPAGAVRFPCHGKGRLRNVGCAPESGAQTGRWHDPIDAPAVDKPGGLQRAVTKLTRD